MHLQSLPTLAGKKTEAVGQTKSIYILKLIAKKKEAQQEHLKCCAFYFCFDSVLTCEGILHMQKAVRTALYVYGVGFFFAFCYLMQKREDIFDKSNWIVSNKVCRPLDSIKVTLLLI